MPEAKLIKEGKIKVYQYPIIQYTQLEERKAFIILIVGQTGSCKKTFINSFINYLTLLAFFHKFNEIKSIENGYWTIR